MQIDFNKLSFSPLDVWPFSTLINILFSNINISLFMSLMPTQTQKNGWFTRKIDLKPTLCESCHEIRDCNCIRTRHEHFFISDHSRTLQLNLVLISNLNLNFTQIVIIIRVFLKRYRLLYSYFHQFFFKKKKTTTYCLR